MDNNNYYHLYNSTRASQDQWFRWGGGLWTNLVWNRQNWSNPVIGASAWIGTPSEPLHKTPGDLWQMVTGFGVLVRQNWKQKSRTQHWIEIGHFCKSIFFRFTRSVFSRYWHTISGTPWRAICYKCRNRLGHGKLKVILLSPTCRRLAAKRPEKICIFCMFWDLTLFQIHYETVNWNVRQ